MPEVIHHPRVAWDTARVVVAAAEADEVFGWLSGEVATILGPEHRRELTDTRARLRWPTGTNAEAVEAGRWRARLQDALDVHPEAAEPLRRLATTATARLRGGYSR
ncbi:hypothetical protein [Micromonospora sp. NBC_01796]|uniref:hypothetical protein n=1 Tax=Micromonospora sp. NBC_01796 TaxID=2975987 RepID=UPI002DD82F26|nr:hypothetical protein [Micromonospora sp. NBC_01796]WSA85571.1 hypothetical protein OIE47_35360 [Micromonospora sp. NBC_01796]